MFKKSVCFTYTYRSYHKSIELALRWVTEYMNVWNHFKEPLDCKLDNFNLRDILLGIISANQ
jgi:hypothetical protein